MGRQGGGGGKNVKAKASNLLLRSSAPGGKGMNVCPERGGKETRQVVRDQTLAHE